MKCVYRSEEGERLVKERYLKFLAHWPVPNQQLRVATREGETFVVACGEEAAPPLVLLHGAGGNAAMWLGEIAVWAVHFRVYAVDMIGEAGLSAASRPPLASEAHALWLDDVLNALGLEKVSFVGVSLGGWLALDYACRRAGRVERLAVLCQGGVGRQRLGFPLKAMVLRRCGGWGQRKMREIVFGKMPAKLPAPIQAFVDFVALIHTHFQTRLEKLPVFGDDALKRLTMPVLAIVGGKDVLLDSRETKQRLERNVSQAEVRLLPDVGHVIVGQAAAIGEFLRLGARQATKNDRLSHFHEQKT